MNWEIITSMKMRPDSPANVFVTASITCALLVTVFAPTP
jgi:hypothetical protein